MLYIINCEPYGYIKYENYDIDNISIHEVEDVKLNIDIMIEDIEIEDVKTNIDIKLENTDIEDVKNNIDIKIEDIEIQKHGIPQNLINIISNKSCPISGIPDYIYLGSEQSKTIVNKYYTFICINNIHSDKLTYEE